MYFRDIGRQYLAIKVFDILAMYVKVHTYDKDQEMLVYFRIIDRQLFGDSKTYHQNNLRKIAFFSEVVLMIGSRIARNSLFQIPKYLNVYRSLVMFYESLNERISGNSKTYHLQHHLLHACDRTGLKICRTVKIRKTAFLTLAMSGAY